MGRHGRGVRHGRDPAVIVNEKLADLLERDELDMDNERHREMYLSTWAAGAFSPQQPETPRGPVIRHG